MQFFNQVRDKVVGNVISKVKPIILKKFPVKRQNGANSKERPPSPSSTNSSISGDPETKGLLSKHSPDATSAKSKAQIDKELSNVDGYEENDFPLTKKRTKNGENIEQTIVIRDIQDKKTKETIEKDLEKLTSTITISSVSVERRKSAETTKKNQRSN